MNVELLIDHGGTLYAPATIENVELSLERSGSAGKLTFKVIKDDVLQIDNGDHVRVKVDDKPFFYGFIFKMSTDKENVISVTAYDQIIYLIKNKDTYVFENKKLSDIVKRLAGDFSMQAGNIADTGYNIPTLTEDGVSLMDIINDAHDQTITNSGEMFVLFDDYGKLTLKNISDMKCSTAITDDTAENFSYTNSIDGETYNKIKLVYDNEDEGARDVFVAQSGENMNKWGVLQYYDSIKKGESGQSKADALLNLYNVPTRSLKITGALGDISVKAGSLIPVVLTVGDQSLKNYLLVEKVTHKLNSDYHSMDLTLKGGVING